MVGGETYCAPGVAGIGGHHYLSGSHLMMDCKLTLNSLVAWACWLLAAACVVADMTVGLRSLRGCEVLFSAAGVAFHVRGMVANLADRERTAFDLGRRSVRSIN